MAITYQCENCDRRYVGPGDLPFECPYCGTSNKPPQRQQNAGRKRIVDALSMLFRRVNPDGLDSQAENGVSIVQSLMDSGTVSEQTLMMARGYLSRSGLDYISEISDEEIDAVIDGLLDQSPEQGVVLWSHIDWSRQQIRDACQLVLQG